MPDNALAPVPAVDGTTIDLLVIGAGTGMAAALAGHEAGLKTLVVEKTEYVGGSTARSGGAFWIPASSLLSAEGASDTAERARTYLQAVVGASTAEERWRSFLEHGEETLQMLWRTTPMRFFWARGYADYHPELPGGSAAGRTCECQPFNLSVLGKERARLRPSTMGTSVPMPITGADYRWMNLVARLPRSGLPRIAKRAAQGLGGKLIGREYAAGGQALAGGLYAGVLRAGIPVWTRTSLRHLVIDGDRVTGAVLEQDGNEVTVTARRGVILAAGGFDHDIEQRRAHQSKYVEPDWSLGSAGNTGDAIRAAQDIGAATDLLEQAWWFPAVAPLHGGAPPVLLAERALPGSFIVDGTGRRFINEATDYMSFGQRLLERERAGDPAGPLWLVFDQQYRNSYVFAGTSLPRMALPKKWYEAGIAHRAGDASALAHGAGLPESALTATLRRFNIMATAGNDEDFGRGNSAYDRYYGDPTVAPNPNLRPLEGQLYAVRVILSDLGTCGGLRADGAARVLRPDGAPVEGLYAIGNTAANAFGTVYPGAGATIGQGLVYATVAARHAARRQ